MHSVGRVVLLPELQQVVAAHVDPVAGGDERRQAEAALHDVVEQSHAEGPGLGEEPEPTRRAAPPATGEAFSRHLRVGVEDAERARPEHPHARCPGPAPPAGAARPAPVRRRSRRSPPTSRPDRGRRLAAQSATTASTSSAGTATTARSTGPGTSVTDAYDGTPATCVGAAGSPRGPLPANPPSSRCRSTVWPTRPGSRPAPTTTTDRGCSSRWTDSGLGPVLARVGDGKRVLGRLEVERQRVRRRRRSPARRRSPRR